MGAVDDQARARIETIEEAVGLIPSMGRHIEAIEDRIAKLEAAAGAGSHEYGTAPEACPCTADPAAATHDEDPDGA